MSEKPILYLNILSPPCRAVLMVGAELGVDFDWKVLDLLNFENTKPEYYKLNPTQTVPLLNDNGVLIADSHAICAYLSDKYADTDRLYPQDLVKRAVVNSRLHFNSGHFFARLRFLYEPVLYMGCGELPEEKVRYIQSTWIMLERFLEDSPYVCGDEMTIADFCLAATAESLTENAPFDTEKHPKVAEWLERMSQLSYYDELNRTPAREIQAGVRAMREKNAESE